MRSPRSPGDLGKGIDASWTGYCLARFQATRQILHNACWYEIDTKLFMNSHPDQLRDMELLGPCRESASQQTSSTIHAWQKQLSCHMRVGLKDCRESERLSECIRQVWSRNVLPLGSLQRRRVVSWSQFGDSSNLERFYNLAQLTVMLSDSSPEGIELHDAITKSVIKNVNFFIAPKWVNCETQTAKWNWMFLIIALNSQIKMISKLWLRNLINYFKYHLMRSITKLIDWSEFCRSSREINLDNFQRDQCKWRLRYVDCATFRYLAVKWALKISIQNIPTSSCK